MGRSVGRVPVQVVLDTNVFISALLKPFSKAADVLRLVLSNQVRLLYDGRILTEYREVALRPTFGFDPDRVRILLDVFAYDGLSVETTPLAEPLPDPDDKPFLQVALAGGAHASLVTGHLRHFPPELRQGCLGLSPREWVDGWMASDSSVTF